MLNGICKFSPNVRFCFKLPLSNAFVLIPTVVEKTYCNLRLGYTRVTAKVLCNKCSKTIFRHQETGKKADDDIWASLDAEGEWFLKSFNPL